MLRGLYTAASGLLANQRRNDVVANNIANVNTAGFKKEETVAKSFQETLIQQINYEKVREAGAPIGKLGKGVMTDEISTDYSAGDLVNTDNPLDIAIVGNGYLTVLDSETGREFYTRDGSLTINPQGQLITQSGHQVLGTNGPINITGNLIEITEGGQVLVDGNDAGTLQIVDISNIKKYGHNLFTGDNPSPTVAQVKQGFLESSNVNAVEEMVKMINIMRSYETSQKVVQAYDNTLEKANEIGRI